MKLKIKGLLTSVIIASLFCFFASAVFAFQNRLCTPPPSLPKSGQKFCKTDAADGNLVKIVCELTSDQDITIYMCTKIIRDWGKSSAPYTHTSMIWRCVNSGKEIIIFDTDFQQDDIRCDIVCGKCAKTWKAAQ
ncbi:MAG: hypothetical protein EG826_13410 [Deltaproteobacteria bacterium]|nr:hypothetical protein [Deltaproteobacteria bacterium]